MTLPAGGCYGSRQMLRKSRTYLVLLLALLALAFFLYKFRNSIALHGFRWATVGASLAHAKWELLLLALATFYACYAVRSLRWMRFSRALGETRFASVFNATVMGFACIFLLGRAGEPIRPVLIARKNSVSMPGMFGVYVLERVFDISATALIAALALLFFENGHLRAHGGDLAMTVARSAGGVLLVAIIAAVGFLIYFRYHGAAWLARKLQHESWRHGWREKMAVLLEGFSEGLRGIHTAGDLGVLAFYTAVHWILVWLAYVFALYAFPGSLRALSMPAIVLVLAITLVGSAVQFPAVGGGAQAATFVALTLMLGVEKEPAAVASIVLWLLAFAGCCIVGLPLLFREGWSMGELRRMARESEETGEAVLLADAEFGSVAEPSAQFASRTETAARRRKEPLR
ncbi:MAG: flippase-like domain-containing protein [Acidobacteriota bacterium]|nr:flippase-like domain-containing protein [Acidobacteriota bacterium]